jgi:hypothetical protein
MPVTCVTGMDCELNRCIHGQGVLDAPLVPPRRSPGLSEDTPRLELPRSLRGFLLLGGLAPRIGTDAATKLISSRPRASSPWQRSPKSWRRG